MPIRQMTKQQILTAENMLLEGYSKSCIAREMNVTRVTLRKILREYREYGDAALDFTSKRYPKPSKVSRIHNSKPIRKEFEENAESWRRVLYRQAG
ncbi:helix-turn-helix domain-containing protein [Aliikangiella coralliicola]|uniref:Helix-turn-helix domain-containing protein n=1 Tax=Aliikangiella coralliicola TaxID=2592383 RepID=A0A545U049_9GAMM|nr:helix-turn-helix domain-containing protein [Aliikangiella coralliicola]TQV82840.1 helix-turn-helix domain-containing protein [Aliikangiella coralliicola]